MNTDSIVPIANLSVFICVNLWFDSSCAISRRCSRVMIGDLEAFEHVDDVRKKRAEFIGTDGFRHVLSPG